MSLLETVLCKAFAAGRELNRVPATTPKVHAKKKYWKSFAGNVQHFPEIAPRASPNALSKLGEHNAVPKSAPSVRTTQRTLVPFSLFCELLDRQILAVRIFSSLCASGAFLAS